MIRPEDIFNAHRVVGSPERYRRTLPHPPGIAALSTPVTDARRRATLGRVVIRTVSERVRPITTRLAPLVPKLPRK